jgi:hypothetical protein
MTTHGETGHDAAPSEGTVTVEETSAGGYTQQIAAGHHRLVADEPRPIGDDLGPTPYDLLLRQVLVGSRHRRVLQRDLERAACHRQGLAPLRTTVVNARRRR